jgi:cysteine synthase
MTGGMSGEISSKMTTGGGSNVNVTGSGTSGTMTGTGTGMTTDSSTSITDMMLRDMFSDPFWGIGGSMLGGSGSSIMPWSSLMAPLTRMQSEINDMKMDISETGNVYTITADVPGT